eukprot:gene18338-24029_t
MIYQTVVLLAILASASAKLFPEKHSHQKYLWESFKRDFGKTYETMEEEVQRFNHFLENLKIADLRNEAEIRAGGSAVHGITKFSDLSQSEFESRYLKADPTQKSKDAQVVTITTPPTASLVDWAGVLTTPVKDQGYCGSCWAFSATEQIESDAIRQLGVEYLLSPEQIVQCDKTSFGCSGGWPERGYSYVKRNGGLETEADYPYTSYYGTTGTCSSSSSKSVVTVSNYYTLTTEDSIASYVQSSGPVSICIDASAWSSYTGGILSVCGNDIDHAVQAVGVYPTTGGYWKVRNSWGTSWGESGFIRLAYGANTCGFTYDVTYTDVAKV